MKKRNPYTFTTGLLSFLFFVAALTSFILIGVSSQGEEDPSTALGMVLILSLVGFGICLILYIIFAIIGYKKNKEEPSPQGVPSTGKSEGEIPCPYCLRAFLLLPLSARNAERIYSVRKNHV